MAWGPPLPLSTFLALSASMACITFTKKHQRVSSFWGKKKGRTNGAKAGDGGGA